MDSSFFIPHSSFPKNLVFDFGGVITVSSREKAVEAFRSIGVSDADMLLSSHHQRGMFADVESGKVTAAGFCQWLSRHCGIEITFADVVKGWTGYVVDVPRERLQFLLEAKKHHNVYILTNTNPFMMSWARSSAFTPEGLPLDAFCHKIYASYEIGLLKPDLRIYNHLINDAAIKPSETLFIDDSLANVEAARRIGMQGLHFITLYLSQSR